MDDLHPAPAHRAETVAIRRAKTSDIMRAKSMERAYINALSEASGTPTVRRVTAWLAVVKWCDANPR